MSFTINDELIAAISKLVDDAQADGYREPSHSDIEFHVGRARLSAGDPKAQGQSVGKAKRVRAVLYYGIDHAPEAAAQFVTQLVAKVRASGGFRPDSSNFVGQEAIRQAVDAFDSVGCSLSSNGALATKRLDALRGKELTKALAAYAERAQRGAQDAALLAGTGKDLLEATAAHVITTKFGAYPQSSNFPTLLGQAFVALELATPEDANDRTEAPQRMLERGLYQAAIGVNRLRNKEGTGHGRPWVAGVSEAEAAAAIETAGVVSGYLLAKLNAN